MGLHHRDLIASRVRQTDAIGSIHRISASRRQIRCELRPYGACVLSFNSMGKFGMHANADSQQPGLLRLLKEDGAANGGSIWRPGFHAMVAYRLGRWSNTGAISRKPALWLATLLRVFVRNIYGISIHWDAKIGRPFAIAHQGAITIHRFCTIGDGCMIRQGGSIGCSDDESPDNAPIIGNHVEIATGAMIRGRVRIGDNVRIGPKTLVTSDIPENSTVFARTSRIETKDQVSAARTYERIN